MKKIAFFIAVFVGLNATSVVRRPEEEEGQAIVQHDSYPSQSRQYSHIIKLLTEKINHYLYAITKDGAFHIIAWNKLTEIMHVKVRPHNRVTKIVFQLNQHGSKENSEIEIL